MAPPDGSTESHQGLRVPLAGKTAGQGKGGSPTLNSVAGLKTTVAEEALVQGPGDGGAGHHDDRDNGGSGRQRSAARPRTPR
jgi:hypothetical protein